MSAVQEIAPATQNADDRAGRGMLTRNVVTSWGGYLVFIVSGFIMPRLIDTHAGQTALGIWDFGFSAVVYLMLAQVGVGVAINRYISQYRAVGDTAGLNRSASSAMCVQLVAAAIALLATAVFVWIFPSIAGERFAGHVDDARWVLALLGTDVAVMMAFDVYRGVLTGCHRWDIHNALESGWYGLSVICMALALLSGFGIRTLAFIYLSGDVIRQIARGIAAHRVCPELHISLRSASWAEARQMLEFGGKAAVQVLSRFLLLNGNNLVVASFLGPASLAFYSRPNSLLRHVETLINKLAFVLTPTASSLQASGEQEKVRELLIASSRYAAGLTVPILLVLGILGDQVLTLWMGPRYAHGNVLAILAAGQMLALTQQPAITVLRGLNIQGWIVLATLISSIVGLAAGVVLVGGLGWGLIGAAIAVGVPVSIGNGLFVAIYASRQVGVPFWEYFRRVIAEPIACSLPFAACLVAARIAFGDRPALALVTGCGIGGLVLAPIYWRYLLPPSIRSRVKSAALRLRRFSVAASASTDRMK